MAQRRHFVNPSKRVEVPIQGALQEYLKAMRQMASMIPRDSKYHYVCFEDFVLERGRPFEYRPLVKKELEVVLDAEKDDVFPEGYCFRNAQLLVLSDLTGSLKYVEGYATSIIPVHHAWATINGAVVDMTWKTLPVSKPREYFGVEFSRDQVKKAQKRKTLSIIDNFEEKWPLLMEARQKPI